MNMIVRRRAAATPDAHCGRVAPSLLERGSVKALSTHVDMSKYSFFWRLSEPL